MLRFLSVPADARTPFRKLFEVVTLIFFLHLLPGLPNLTNFPFTTYARLITLGFRFSTPQIRFLAPRSRSSRPASFLHIVGSLVLEETILFCDLHCENCSD